MAPREKSNTPSVPSRSHRPINHEEAGREEQRRADAQSSLRPQRARFAWHPLKCFGYPLARPGQLRPSTPRASSSSLRSTRLSSASAVLLRPRQAPRAVPPRARPCPPGSPAPRRPRRGRRTQRWSAVSPGAPRRLQGHRCSWRQRADPVHGLGNRPLRCTSARPRSRVPRFLHVGCVFSGCLYPIGG
jgi:hypothetical protein